jgi:hypothetical protein
MGLIVEETDAPYNLWIVILGILLLAVRIYSMRAFILSNKTAKSLKIKEDYDPQHEGWFSPMIHHASYYIAILFSLALIFSFRVKILNAIPLVFLPSVFISIPGKDIPVLIKPEKFNTKRGSLFWFNFITLHIPLAIMGVYMIIMRNYMISIFAFWVGFAIVIILFLGLDDKDNGVINGKKYIQVGLALLVIWTLIVTFTIFVNLPTDTDPMIAPIYSISFS